METRANYVLIGAFTLAVIAAAFGFVLWFQSLHTTKLRSPIRIVFEGPASGLRNGGSVNFNGIRIGEVVSVKLDNPRRVVALAMVENNAPIRKDTLVGLEFQGLTGVAAISLKGGEEAAPSGSARRRRRARADGRSERAAGRDRGDPRHAAERQPDRRRQPGIGEELAAKSRNIHRARSRATPRRSTTSCSGSTACMGKADSLMLGLNTIAGGNAGGELNLMVKSIRELAEDFDKRSGALMADGRRTLCDISRAVNNFDRNPSRVIFGGSNNAAPAEPPKPPTCGAARPRAPSGQKRQVGRPRTPNVVSAYVGLEAD